MEKRWLRKFPIAFRIYKIPRRFGSIQEIERWVEGEERKLAKASRLPLAQREKSIDSRAAKKTRLPRVSRLIIQEILEELKRFGYLSDADFTRVLIEREMRKGYGPLYIEMKLRSLGLECSQVRKVVHAEAQKEAIRKLAPRLKNPAAALQRRGFDAELISRELKKFYL